jgi:ABC-type branched-subunit amino acid transport system permease subunit
VTLFISYLAIGVTEGLVYGLLALGMVLIYKGSRTINFAHPFFGLVTAFVCWWLTAKASFFPFTLMPFAAGTRPRFVLAVVLSLAFIGLYGFGVEHGIMRRLRRAPRLVTLVATIAIAQGALGLVTLVFTRTPDQQAQSRVLPELMHTQFFIGQQLITGAHISVLIVTAVVGAYAAWFFTRTRFGVAVRAAAENGDAARLLGISADRVAAFVWVAGSILAGVAGILVSQVKGGSVDVTTLSLGFLVRGLTAALIGGLTSLPGAVVGGLIVGITQEMLVWRFPHPTEQGLPELALFVFVVLVLLFRPGGLFGQREDTEDKVGFVPVLRELPARLRGTVAANAYRVVTTVAVVVVALAGFTTTSANTGLIVRMLAIAIVGVGLTVLMGYAGQISLGHWALAGVGAFATATFVTRLHVPYLLALPLAIAAGMLVSLAIGLPALRIRGLYLAIVTLGFNLACQVYLFKQSAIGGSSAGRDLTPPKIGPFDLADPSNRPLLGFTILCLVLVLLVARNIANSRTGRAFFALRENEKAAATLGVRLTRYKLLAFAVSGGIAALGGALYASSLGFVRADDYQAPFSLTLIAIVIVGGLGSPYGAVFGALVIRGIPDLVKFNNLWIVPIGSGLLLLIVIVRARGGIAGLLALVREKVIGAIDEMSPEPTAPAAGEPPTQ